MSSDVACFRDAGLYDRGWRFERHFLSDFNANAFTLMGPNISIIGAFPVADSSHVFFPATLGAPTDIGNTYSIAGVPSRVVDVELAGVPQDDLRWGGQFRFSAGIADVHVGENTAPFFFTGSLTGRDDTGLEVADLARGRNRVR